MYSSKLDAIEKRNGAFFFKLLDEDSSLILKSAQFESLLECHKAMILVKQAIANTTLSTTHVKLEE